MYKGDYMKFVKSTDPRKKLVVQQFKQLFGANKVTEVREVSQSRFSGRCFKSLGNRKYYFLGEHTVELGVDVTVDLTYATAVTE
jgi:hypothetical protein